MPSIELLAIILAILVPVAIFCWRTVSAKRGSQAVLALQWPEDRRLGATLQLNGVPQKVAMTGVLEYAVQAGEVRIVAATQGCKPFAKTVLVEAGQKTLVRTTWQESHVARQSPNTEPQQAKAQASLSPDKTAADAPAEATASGSKVSAAIVPPADAARHQQPKQEASAAGALQAAVGPVKRPEPSLNFGGPRANARLSATVPNASAANQPSAPPPVASRAQASPVPASVPSSQSGAAPESTGRAAPPQNGSAGASTPDQLPPNVTLGRVVTPSAAAPSPSNAPTVGSVRAGAVAPAVSSARPGSVVATVGGASGPAFAAPGNALPVGNVASGTIAPAPSVGPAGSVVATAGSVSSPAPAAAAPAAKSPVKPIVIAANPEIDRLLAEAWGLIERGDYEPGGFRLQEARKKDRNDPRAEFSLGLLDGLVNGNWISAEKRFADCVRRCPNNVPALNNLAIAELHNKREMEAVKHWKTIVDQHAATAEVVQNLGRVRHLIKQGEIRKNPSLVKLLDDLYTQAAVATSQSCQPQAGFRIMALQLADGRSVGWGNPRKMEDASAFAKASASSRSTASQSASVPGRGAPGTTDPRVQPAGQSQPGAAGQPSQAPNVPVAPGLNRAKYPSYYNRTR